MSLIHKLDEFYRTLYLLSRQISKQDRFGIYSKIESVFLEILELVITAALENKQNKGPILNSARVKIEVLKRLVRISCELKIIEYKKYISLESDLQEISKMVNGWIRYLNK